MKKDEMDREERRFEELIGAAGAEAPALDKAFLERLRGQSSREFLAAQSPRPSHERIGWMSTFKKALGVAAVLCVAAGVAGLMAYHFIWGSGGATVAWADVQKQIQNVQNFSYTMTMEMPKTTHNVPENMQIRMIVTEPGLMRQEFARPTQAVTIMDFESGRMLRLQQKMRIASIINLQGLPGNAANTFSEQNWMRRLKDLARESATEAGEKEIKGKRSKGYLVNKNGQDMTVWVDPRTAEAVEIEVALPGGTGRVVMSDFEFNQDLDMSLFSMEPPAGYTMSDKPMTIEVKEPSFEDVTAILGLMAKANDGQFPDELPNMARFASFIKEQQDKPDEKASEEEQMKRTMALTRALMFLMQNEKSLHYAGKGVKLGDAKTPIVWYRPENVETFKAIYGDLSVKDPAAAPDRG